MYNSTVTVWGDKQGKEMQLINDNKTLKKSSGKNKT